MNTTTPHRSSSLVIVDGVSLLVFTVIGLRMHGAGVSPGSLLRDVIPILGAWYLLAPTTRVYRAPGWSSLLVSWAIAIPAGVLLRQIWMGRLVSRATVAFLVAAMSLTLAFLLAGRVVVILAQRARSQQKPTR